MNSGNDESHKSMWKVRTPIIYTWDQHWISIDLHSEYRINWEWHIGFAVFNWTENGSIAREREKEREVLFVCAPKQRWKIMLRWNGDNTVSFYVNLCMGNEMHVECVWPFGNGFSSYKMWMFQMSFLRFIFERNLAKIGSSISCKRDVTSVGNFLILVIVGIGKGQKPASTELNHHEISTKFIHKYLDQGVWIWLTTP